MNLYNSQQTVELTEVTVNQEVFDIMNNSNEVAERANSTVDIESVIPENRIMSKKSPNKIGNMNEPPSVKATNSNTESDLVKNSNESKKTVVKTEVMPDDSLANFRALSLHEVIDLWSELSKIPTPECKCKSKKLKKYKK